MAKRKPRRSRRSFSDEYKAEVVALVRTSGKSIGQVSREMDLTETAVRDRSPRIPKTQSVEPKHHGERLM